VRLRLGLELRPRGEGVGDYGVGVGRVEDRRQRIELLAGTQGTDMVKVVEGMRAGQAFGFHCGESEKKGRLARSRTVKVKNSLFVGCCCCLFVCFVLATLLIWMCK
jgi:hypothetical protein